MTTSKNDVDLVARLERRIEELEGRLGVVEDVQAIKKLQYQYGYYLDKCYYDQVVDLFADEGARVHFLRGVFHGKDGVRRLYCGRFKNKFAQGRNGPRHGHLLDHPQLQGVIDVDPGRTTARARFRTIMQAGTHETVPESRSYKQWWEAGLYENTYVREDGHWKIQVLNYRQFWLAPYERGWSGADADYSGYLTATYPDDPSGPDEIVADWALFPDTTTFPFHYDHPITGEPVGE